MGERHQLQLQRDSRNVCSTLKYGADLVTDSFFSLISPRATVSQTHDMDGGGGGDDAVVAAKKAQGEKECSSTATAAAAAAAVFRT